MKVALVTSHFIPESVGGIEIHVHNLAKELAKKKIDVTVLTHSQYNSRIEYTSLGYKVIRFKSIPFYQKSQISLELLHHIISGNYDLIHVHLYVHFATEFAILRKLIRKTPIIATLHNYKGRQTILAEIYIKIFLDRYFKLFDAIITTTNVYKRLISKKTKKPVYVIPNGISDTFFSEKNINIEPSSSYILFVGSLEYFHWYKGVEFLLKAFELGQEKLSNFKLVLVGEGELKNKYISLANELGISEKVVFLGEVKNRNLPRLYAGASVTVLPSFTYETFGIVLLESIAVGTPVVATDLLGIKEVIGSFGKIVAPRNPVSLLKGIEWVLNHHYDKEEMRNYAKNFRWKNITEKVFMVYSSRLNTNPPRKELYNVK